MDTNLSSVETTSIPIELTGASPRRLRLSGNGILMAFASAIMLALTASFAIWDGRDRAQQLEHRAALRHGAREVVGEITRLWSPGRSHKTRVGYTFVVNGISFAGEAQVPKQLAPTLRKSEAIAIRFLPADPAINHPAAWEWSALLDWDSLGTFVVGLALGLFPIWALRPERRLVAKGLPAVGEITKCVPAGRGGFSVNFDFHTEDGSVTKGSGWSQGRREIGERVCVLYLPENPKRNLSYPALNYRVIRSSNWSRST